MKRILVIALVIMAVFAAQNALAGDRHLQVDGKGGWTSPDQKDMIIPDNAGGWWINNYHFIPDGPDAWKTTDGKYSIKMDGDGGWWVNDDHYVPDGQGNWQTTGGKTVKSDGADGWIINH